ncbi:Uncharacterised protein [Buttiauxella agrestis]|uniref:Uncharacterized protein n=1 Tax=Buttiauxella agrestis TaxID=82977 RepID=A0A381KPA5_9ENTR|nr:hypothetical protein [Buttiauxella agrestis]SUY92832.1 Uncharacterised protein [Buttiauxella agrestis]
MNKHNYNPRIYALSVCATVSIVICILCFSYWAGGTIYDFLYSIRPSFPTDADKNDYLNITGLPYVQSMFRAFSSVIGLLIGLMAAVALTSDIAPALRYRLGARGFQRLRYIQKKKADSKAQMNNQKMELEAARVNYWRKWKEYNGSNLSYEEWKDRFCEG